MYCKEEYNIWNARLGIFIFPSNTKHQGHIDGYLSNTVKWAEYICISSYKLPWGTKL